VTKTSKKMHEILKAGHEKYAIMRQKKTIIIMSLCKMLRIQGVLLRRLKAYFIKRLSNTAAMGHALTGKAQQTRARLETNHNFNNLG